MRALELSGNRLAALPDKEVATLDSLRVLRLSGNQLTAAGLPWNEMASCTSLLTLVLDSNPCVACPQRLDTKINRQGSIFTFWAHQSSLPVGHAQWCITGCVTGWRAVWLVIRCRLSQVTILRSTPCFLRHVARSQHVRRLLQAWRVAGCGQRPIPAADTVASLVRLGTATGGDRVPAAPHNTRRGSKYSPRAASIAWCAVRFYALYLASWGLSLP